MMVGGGENLETDLFVGLIGLLLGVGGHMEELRRVRSGAISETVSD